MRSLDFEYDGLYLSDFGFIVCDFNSSSSISEVSAGSNITFVKTARQHGAKHSLVYTKYNECMTATFDICKDPCLHNEDMEITADEFRDIMRWLNRKEFLLFHVLADEGAIGDVETCYHNASFNVSKLEFNGRLYGIRLKMETDTPFAHGREFVYKWSTDQKKSKQIMDMSDEIGFVYPKLVITCKEDCDLTITNESEGCVSEIKNCKSGEVITMHGNTNIITTSYAGHDISDDFNYEFFRFGNTATRRENIITASHNCDIEMRYSPIIKYAQL